MFALIKCLKDLYKAQPNIFKEPIIKEMLEFEWSMWLAAKKQVISSKTAASCQEALNYPKGIYFNEGFCCYC